MAIGSRKRRIGVVGYGLIGSHVFSEITRHPEWNVEIAFVHDVDPSRLARLPHEVLLPDLTEFPRTKPDMICELAHPDVTRRFGAQFLQTADYFPLSVTAFADEGLEDTLRAVAAKTGTRLFIPHGGVMGLDALIDGARIWEEVSIFMRKNPRNLDFARSGIDPSSIAGDTLLYEGTTRGVCLRFPRNVNTHATVALAGIGFDRTRSTLHADPSCTTAVMEVRAHGGGVDMVLKRSEAISGVSGASTPWSVLRSILSTSDDSPGLQFC